MYEISTIMIHFITFHALKILAENTKLNENGLNLSLQIMPLDRHIFISQVL